MSGYRCLCGGRAWTLAELVAESGPGEWADYWRSVMDPFSFYCVDEDDVLTDMEAWRVMGLKLPVHDEDWAFGVCGDVWNGKGDPSQELIW